jgi:hypothetical protein
LVRLVAGARPDDKDPPEALRPFEDSVMPVLLSFLSGIGLSIGAAATKDGSPHAKLARGPAGACVGDFIEGEPRLGNFGNDAWQALRQANGDLPRSAGDCGAARRPGSLLYGFPKSA